MSRKYGEAEKYFKVCAEMFTRATKNPANIFAGKANLLLLFTHTNIGKAKSYAERLLEDIDETLPAHQRELYFMTGNIYLLLRDYERAKDFYRKCLQLQPKPKQESQLLNNLAYACWQHMMQEARSAEPSESYEQVAKEFRFAHDYLK